MGFGPPPVSPFVYSARDFAGHTITVTIDYDNNTRVILGGLVERDTDCLYVKVYIGTGGDGRPDSTTHKFNAQSGSHAINAAVLAAIGITTIEDILNSQITVGP